ncbi:MAG: DUF2779 domain-containing protein [Deltaproteobacteria bacterium]
MYLSKTDYLEYLQCPKNLWLKKKKPELYISIPPSDFDLKNFREGQEVEALARNLFSDGYLLNGDPKRLAEQTNELITLKKSPIFQATFITDRGLIAKIDILDSNKRSGCWDIYEVKSSNDIKTDREHNHIKDVTFQALVMRGADIPVGEVYIVHLNKDYIKNGDVDLEELFVKENVSEKIINHYDITKLETDEALELLEYNDIDLSSCPCIYMTRGNHCSSFSVFNPNVPDYSVHDVSRIRSNKIQSLIDSGVVAITDIPDSFQLTDKQRLQVNLETSQKPLIDRESVYQALSQLEYPLYFLDYETFMVAIPILDGYRPHQHMPFQVSIHKIDIDGKLLHFEYLADNIEYATIRLIEFLKEIILPEGTVISWHASFENAINKGLAELHPEHSDFLLDLNNRTFDLEQLFKNDYLHPEFKGRTSIKNVLPVLLPRFSYEDLVIQDGTAAMEGWRKMIFDDIPDSEKEIIKKALLEYCKMDTLAMVEIYNHLKSI